MRLALNPFVQPRYFSSDGFKMRSLFHQNLSVYFIPRYTHCCSSAELSVVLTWLKNLLKIVRGCEQHQVVFLIHRCWLEELWSQYNLASWGQVYILCLLGPHQYAYRTFQSSSAGTSPD